MDGGPLFYPLVMDKGTGIFYNNTGLGRARLRLESIAAAEIIPNVRRHRFKRLTFGLAFLPLPPSIRRF